MRGNLYHLSLRIFTKIQNKEFDDNEFIKLSNGKLNLNNTIIKSLYDEFLFDSDSLKLLYSLNRDSYVLITGAENNIYLAKIKNIINKNLPNGEYEEYLIKSNNEIVSEIQNSYDLSINQKYKVKVFANTLDRIKNNFK